MIETDHFAARKPSNVMRLSRLLFNPKQISAQKSTRKSTMQRLVVSGSPFQAQNQMPHFDFHHRTTTHRSRSTRRVAAVSDEREQLIATKRYRLAQIVSKWQYVGVGPSNSVCQLAPSLYARLSHFRHCTDLRIDSSRSQAIPREGSCA